MDFQLNEELLRLLQCEQDGGGGEAYFIPNETDVPALSSSREQLNAVLDGLVDRVEEDLFCIMHPDTFDVLRSFVKNLSAIKHSSKDRIMDIVLSGFKNAIAEAKSELQTAGTLNHEDIRAALERYAFLLLWLIRSADASDASRRPSVKGATAAAAAGKLKRGQGSKEQGGSTPWDWTQAGIRALDLMARVLGLNLRCIWTSGPELDTFLSLLTKPCYQLLESPSYAKMAELKIRIFKVIGLCVQHFGHSFAVQDTILQQLEFYEHSAESLAELLQHLVEHSDNAQVAYEVLRNLSRRQFHAARRDQLHDSTFPKTVGRFLVRLSEIAPKIILKHIGLLSSLLDSESHNIRMHFIEVVGNLIMFLARSTDEEPEETERRVNDVSRFFDILEERFYDENAYCRSKTLQICERLCELREKSSAYILSGYSDAEASKNVRVEVSKRWRKIIDLTIERTTDKTYLVRKNAVSLLTKLLCTHPYNFDGGHVDANVMTEKLEGCDNTLEVLMAEFNSLAFRRPAGSKKKEDGEEDDELIGSDKENNHDDGEDAEMEEPVNIDVADLDARLVQEGGMDGGAGRQSAAGEQGEDRKVALSRNIVRTRLLRAYYAEVVHFIQQLDRAVDVLCQLLASPNRGEVVEVMEYFVAAHARRLQSAKLGIKQMVHLIWMKDTNTAAIGGGTAGTDDDSKSVRGHVVDCYYRLYFAREENQPDREYFNTVTANLITLILSMALAERTSFEQLICTMVAHDVEKKSPVYVHHGVVETLWATYGSSNQEITKQRRRGAIIALGMIAKADQRIVESHVDLMLRIGMGERGKADLALAKYTCIALQRLGGGIKKRKVAVGENPSIRFPNDHPVFQKLNDMLEVPTRSPEWFPLAEQIISTIYLLGTQPDSLCTHIVRSWAAKVFGLVREPAGPSVKDGDQEDDTHSSSFISSKAEDGSNVISSFELSQLAFIIGHVALKQVVHLEEIENEWKRNNEKSQASKGAAAATGGDEDLEAAAGTAEDDFADRVNEVREYELLFGKRSLLAVFGPIVARICANNTRFADRTLKSMSTLALCKMMCVSSEFCRDHLGLLFTILEKSDDPVVRSNVVIGLGDIAVCFNSLVDADISQLYSRLSDLDRNVKRQALMVLTFLILNGMVKVKGQIGEMAKCVVEPDDSISGQAKLFFSELASKENAVYNNLPDIISTLSTGENAVDEEAFRKIMKFLFDLIGTKNENDPGSSRKVFPERQAENMVEKLCQRFPTAEGPRQWRDISYCLTSLPFKSERSFKRLLDNLPHYQDKLHDETVYKNISDILTKKGSKPEFKAVVDELKAKVDAFHERGN